MGRTRSSVPQCISKLFRRDAKWIAWWWLEADGEVTECDIKQALESQRQYQLNYIPNMLGMTHIDIGCDVEFYEHDSDDRK